VTIARADVAARCPERKPSRRHILQTAAGSTLPILNEALVKLTLGRRPITTRVFVANITDEFILALDVVYAHDASVDLRRHARRLGDELEPLWDPGARPCASRYRKRSSEVAVVR
jgi:hypothetical protein